jgi:hypothetical protein
MVEKVAPVGVKLTAFAKSKGKNSLKKDIKLINVIIVALP